MNFFKFIFLGLSVLIITACTISSIDHEKNDNKPRSVDGCDGIFSKAKHCKTEPDTQRIHIEIE